MFSHHVGLAKLAFLRQMRAHVEELEEFRMDDNRYKVFKGDHDEPLGNLGEFRKRLHALLITLHYSIADSIAQPKITLTTEPNVPIISPHFTLMQHQHPNHPPLIPREALVGHLRPYPIEWRNEITESLQPGRGVPISRAFLALCNLNLLEYALWRKKTIFGGRCRKYRPVNHGIIAKPYPGSSRISDHRRTSKLERSRKHYRGAYSTFREPYGSTDGDQPYHTICNSSAAASGVWPWIFHLGAPEDPLADLDPNGQLSEYEVRFMWVPQYRSRLPVPGDNENQHGLEDHDHEADGDDVGEENDEELFVLQSEGDWGLT
ncbi:hypothetical protein BGX38DRAFT_1269400 [Terfezia claveryi]|nr:hypothetical protein BGX38DRAFT_1269400 [Terfezia claveryi]